MTSSSVPSHPTGAIVFNQMHNYVGLGFNPEYSEWFYGPHYNLVHGDFKRNQPRSVLHIGHSGRNTQIGSITPLVQSPRIYDTSQIPVSTLYKTVSRSFLNRNIGRHRASRNRYRSCRSDHEQSLMSNGGSVVLKQTHRSVENLNRVPSLVVNGNLQDDHPLASSIDQTRMKPQPPSRNEVRMSEVKRHQTELIFFNTGAAIRCV